MRFAPILTALLFAVLKVQPGASRALALVGRAPAGPLNYEEPYSPDEMEKRAGPLNYEEPYSPDEMEKRAGPLNYEEPYSPDELD
ncbi:hypothetical protein C8F04DRAFT_1272318 [Mycena alexandri]|uniref:Uncharacterized protein n=1 Tax=Mycena alexandri TaxID=1745969 RepID=A0AAD6WPY0_9AGAR|nr:hypothetical protein C8F04DRAFT_1272318 [Mycena alexandri]